MCSRRAFTLMELLVVLSIISVLGWVFMATIGSIRGGDPLENAAIGIKGMIQKGRSSALSQGSSFELLVDFEKNQIIPIQRRPVAFFGFESGLGAKGRLLDLSDNAFLDGDFRPRQEGQCLKVGGYEYSSASARIAHSADYNPLSVEDGIVISLDVNPRVESGEQGTIISKGSQWAIEIKADLNVCELSARVKGKIIETRVPIPAYTWSHIELMISPISIRLYANHIPSALPLVDTRLELDSADTEAIVLGGSNYVPMYVDNLRIEQLIVEEPFELPLGAWLVPPGGEPQRAVDEILYELPARQENQPEEERYTLPTEEESLPPFPYDGVPIPVNPEIDLPVKQALIFFDERGQLDLNSHAGPLRLVLAGVNPEIQFAYRYFVDISVMGIVTHEASGDAPLPEEDEALLLDDPDEGAE